jgi:hypothetical protein
MQVIEEPTQKELIKSLEVANFGKTLIDMKTKSTPDTHAVRKTIFPESGFVKIEKKSANMMTSKFMFTRKNNFLLFTN